MWAVPGKISYWNGKERRRNRLDHLPNPASRELEHRAKGEEDRVTTKSPLSASIPYTFQKAFSRNGKQ
jgi:hypothetical protein